MGGLLHRYKSCPCYHTIFYLSTFREFDKTEFLCWGIPPSNRKIFFAFILCRPLILRTNQNFQIFEEF